MLVKEEDAVRFFCPAVSGAQQHVVCKGSHCMAWRWYGDARDEASKDGERTPKDLGYCGLAGALHSPKA